jgi:hypothetical protein
VGRLCQWVFPKPNAQGPQSAGRHAASIKEKTPSEHYFQIVISGSRDLTKNRADDLGSVIQDDLAKVFPRVRHARLLRYKVVTDPQAVFSVVPGGQRFRPKCQSDVDNLWLAGDWTRTGWPATMEGAILSGMTAAEKVLAK